MERSFWLQRWESNQIAFHASDVNPLLVEHFDKLRLDDASRVFLPLCGKTLDISWLLSKGHRVVGVELSETAIEQLFAELGVSPEVSTHGSLRKHSARHPLGSDIDIFVGDIFALTAEMLGAVDATYDRAALVALPEAVRARYTKHLTQITDRAPQLLICFEYDQQAMPGPPFSIDGEEVHRHYRHIYDLSPVASLDVPGKLKGLCRAKENAWLLRRD